MSIFIKGLKMKHLRNKDTLRKTSLLGNMSLKGPVESMRGALEIHTLVWLQLLSASRTPVCSFLSRTLAGYHIVWRKPVSLCVCVSHCPRVKGTSHCSLGTC